MHPRTRLAAVAALTAALIMAVAAPAFAHVTAVADTTASGAYAKITLRVPHGCDGAPTNAVRVQIPDGVVSVRPQVNPNWELEVVEGELAEPYESDGETITEGVTEVAWVGGDLPDGHLDEFGLSVKLPDDAEGQILSLPVVQECGDTESAWIEIPDSPDAEEPEHPAPSLTLTAAEAEAHGANGHGDGSAEGPAGADAEAGAADAQVTALTSDTRDAEPTSAMSTGTNRLTVLALVAGLLGLVLGATALVTVRRH